MKKCCCSCTHNIRQTDENRIIRCYCEIDGHYIGYVACFENVCEKYEKGQTDGRSNCVEGVKGEENGN